MSSHPASSETLPQAPAPATYLDQGPSVFIEGSATAGVWHRLNNYVTHESALRKRAEILALPSNESGIDRARIDAYCDGVGIPHTALTFLSPAEFVQARTLAGTREAGDAYGEYAGLPDVAMVERNAELEELNGPELIESFAIHERAHGGAKPKLGKPHSPWANLMRLAIRGQVLPDPVRMGFHRINRYGGSLGLFLEEGYAEYERGQYVVDVLNRPDGFAPPLQGAFEAFNKYRFLVHAESGEEIAAMPPGADGAVVIEELVRLDPEILPLIRDCRGNYARISELSARLDGIRPGLYAQLSDIGLGKGYTYPSAELEAHDQ